MQRFGKLIVISLKWLFLCIEKEGLTMSGTHENNPLHGVKLKDILESLVEYYGWGYLGGRVDIRCFNFDPSIGSSLKFLRKTDWARKKVEEVYFEMLKSKESKEG